MTASVIESIKRGTYVGPERKIKPSVQKAVSEALEEVRDALQTKAANFLVNVYIDKAGTGVNYMNSNGDTTLLFPVAQWIGAAHMLSLKGTLKEKLVTLLLDRMNDVVKLSMKIDLH